MRYCTYLSAIFLLAVPAAASAAHCQPVFASGDQAVTIDGVEIEPGGSAKQDFMVRVRDADGAGGGPGGPGSVGPGNSQRCPATIRVARYTPSPDPDFPAYTLSAPGNRQIEILPDLTTQGSANSDVEIANAPPGPQGRAVPFSIELGTEWGLPAGTYVEQLQLSLFDHDEMLVDQSIVTITIVIPSSISLRLFGAVVGSQGPGPAQIELGDLSATDETRADRFGALIFSTAPYTVSFNSDNQGSLRHEQGGQEIAYRLYFDGRQVDLTGPNTFFYPQRTPKSGDRRPMEIVVPPVTSLAGRYTDRIAITATAM